MSTAPIQTPPPLPTRSPIMDSTGLVTRTWLNWFTFLGNLFATVESPAFAGLPTAPTAPSGTNTTQIASTGFVGTAVAAETSRAATAEAALNASVTAERVRAQAAEALKAPIASPTFTGTVTQPGPAVLTAAATATTATAGAASALPATPTGYLQASINGVTVKIPFYSI